MSLKIVAIQTNEFKIYSGSEFGHKKNQSNFRNAVIYAATGMMMLSALPILTVNQLQLNFIGYTIPSVLVHTDLLNMHRSLLYPLAI